MTDKRYGLVHISKPLKDVFKSLLDTAESKQMERMKKVRKDTCKRKLILSEGS